MCIQVERHRHFANFGSHITHVFKRDGDVKKALGRLEQHHMELLHFSCSDCTEVAFMSVLLQAGHFASFMKIPGRLQGQNNAHRI